jgi:hypothetical protein
MDPDPDPGCPKTYGSHGSGSATLPEVIPRAIYSIAVTACTVFVSVPDPPDPHVFRPAGSGSTCEVWIRIRLWIRIPILLSSCKNNKKNLESYYFVTLFDFLSLKNNVKVPSKSNKQKKLC